MGYAIQTFGLVRKFGKKTAVCDLNLKVPERSVFAFLGPNGAGKTTTIKTLVNILSPSAGQAQVLGVDSRKLGPLEFSQIGYVSVDQQLPEWMKIGEFLAYCKNMYSTWDDQFCQEIISQFNLPLNEPIKNLSRGMRMKAALVSSIAYRPRLLIFDEPFSGLDPLVRQDFIDGILKLTEAQHWTIFISSHDIDEVERLADWVGIIDQGQMKIQEETDSLLQRFRKVEVVFQEDVQLPQKAVPQTWLFFQASQRKVQFIDSMYEDQGLLEATFRGFYPGATHLSVSAMSLKEIFLVLAGTFKMTNR